MHDPGKVEFIKSGIRKHVLYKILDEMVIDTWKQVSTDKRILNGFRQCGYFDFDGIIDKFHSRLRDTIKNRGLLYNLI